MRVSVSLRWDVPKTLLSPHLLEVPATMMGNVFPFRCGIPSSALVLSVAFLMSGCGGTGDQVRSDALTRSAEEGSMTHPVGERGVESVGTGEGVAATSLHGGAAGEVVVYKSPTCGCCSLWADHMEEAGFQVTRHDQPNPTPVKDELGVPRPLRSCHTAVVGGYVIEGHVPADVVRRLLDERPPVAGLAVPGMPIGSPGMEVPGRPADSYEILAFDDEGSTVVYESR